MSALAPILEAFFTDRLVQQRHASPHTIAAYRDAWRLLIRFAAADLTTAPSKLKLSDLDAPLIGRFLEHLERGRANTVRTRNARLLRNPEDLERPIRRKVNTESGEVEQQIRDVEHRIRGS